MASLMCFSDSICLSAGRATVELILERKGDESAFVDQKGGGPIRQARLGITLDGYSAPLTAGNMAANIQDGIYNGKPLNASYASVLAGAGALPGKSPITYCTWHVGMSYLLRPPAQCEGC